MDKIVNIIVIGYNFQELEVICLKSIQQNTTYPYLLTFFDNFNSGYTLTKIWNKLVQCSPCEFICLLNNDTQVQKNWLDRMMATLLTGPKDVGFVGPSTDQCHSLQKTIDKLEMADRYFGKAIRMTDPISGFCFLFRKSLWKKLGGFDEKYTLYGQESDLIDRAQNLGYYGYWRQDAFVHHVGEASVLASGINSKNEREKAKEIYWSTRKK